MENQRKIGFGVPSLPPQVLHFSYRANLEDRAARNIWYWEILACGFLEEARERWCL